MQLGLDMGLLEKIELRNLQKSIPLKVLSI